jgi:hypothetical protein
MGRPFHLPLAAAFAAVIHVAALALPVCAPVSERHSHQHAGCPHRNAEAKQGAQCHRSGSQNPDERGRTGHAHHASEPSRDSHAGHGVNSSESGEPSVSCGCRADLALQALLGVGIMSGPPRSIAADRTVAGTAGAAALDSIPLTPPEIPSPPPRG